MKTKKTIEQTLEEIIERLDRLEKQQPNINIFPQQPINVPQSLPQYCPYCGTSPCRVGMHVIC